MKMSFNKEKIGINVLITSLAISGLFSVTAGAVTNKMTLKNKSDEVKIKIRYKSTAKSNAEPKLKNIEIEINMPLSVDVKDYIENASSLNKETLRKCKLDTSLVNVNEVGTYTYQITYKDKKYNGTVTVKEKEGALDKLTLKDINITVGGQLPTEESAYIVEPLTDDIKSEITFDTSKVDITKAGIYSYTVTYKNTVYQGKITVAENKPAQTVQDNGALNDEAKRKAAEEAAAQEAAIKAQQEKEAQEKAAAEKKAKEDAERQKNEDKYNCIAAGNTFNDETGKCIVKDGTTTE